MIVLSLLLVLIAAVTLIAGFFQQESLTLIWVSIGSCIGAMVFLAIAMVQRRGRGPATATGPAEQPRVAGSRPTSGADADPGASSVTASTRPTTSTAPSGDDRGSDDRAPSSDGAGDGAGTAGGGTGPTVRRAVVRRAVVRRRPPEGQGTSSPASPADPERPASTAAPATPTAPTSRPVRPRSRPVSRPSSSSGPEPATPAVTADDARASGAPTEGASGTGRDASGDGGRSELETARRVLASIRGVGPAKQEALLTAFGSLEALRGASERDLADVRGIGPRLAATIHRTLHR